MATTQQFNNPAHLSKHVKDAKILGDGYRYVLQAHAAKKCTPPPLNAALTPTPVTIKETTRVGMSNEIKAIYQSNNFDKITKLQTQYQKDLLPLYQFIQQNGYNAWQAVQVDKYGDSFAFMVWDEYAIIWAYCYSIGMHQTADGVRTYQAYCQSGIQSTTTGTIGTQSYVLGVPYQFQNFIDGGWILARGLTPFFNRGLDFNYRKFGLALSEGANNSYLGYKFNFYTPPEAVGATIDALVFNVIYLGMRDQMVNTKEHRTRVAFFNWDPNNYYNIVSEASENLLSAGQGDVKEIAIAMNKMTYSDYNIYVFPKFVTLNPDVVIPYSVHVYHNHVDTSIEQSQVAYKVSQIQSFQLPNPYGFSYAANLPQLGNHGQFFVNQPLDPQQVLQKAQGNFVTTPLTITNYTQNGTPITTSMVSTSQGVFGQLFDYRVHFNYNSAPSKL
ncbi:hypothetical protein CYY_007767 [Polysphondylium violaceum]|uniref:Uncharacterized protein n=1 Tax=Polysphondylium violaceum TaxID=133409 RepID=A0A8J4PNV7_9MYCE|nr:hypothetical protein CYY_007767 [Polysphondylium violaceum]